ncbi:MAG: dihydropteroate synthase [Pseudomonadota bacterium]
MSACVYLRALPDPPGRPGGLPLAGGALRFSEVAVHRRGAPAEVLPADAVGALYGEDRLACLTAARAPLAGLQMDRPNVMGVVNVTPDSFSDGGQHDRVKPAVAHGLALAAQGADLIDIGGESTRPGAEPVPVSAEIDRVIPVIEGLVAAGCPIPISIDTRKAAVADAALTMGAVLFNDVSALTYDPASIAVKAPAYCLMHAQGDPRTMQEDPRYQDVLLDIYDFLEARISAAEAAGIPRARIVIDPGIGFGKTMAHNLALIRGLSLFHDLGCPVLLGASRKRFIGTLSEVSDASKRGPGSVAAALWGAGQGAQILRVHDVAETVQALRIWRALQEGT